MWPLCARKIRRIQAGGKGQHGLLLSGFNRSGQPAISQNVSLKKNENMKIIPVILFLLSEESAELKQFWRAEITSGGKLNPFRLYMAHRSRTRHFLMWWRLASQMSIKGNKQQKRAAKKIHWSLQCRYASDISLKAAIGINPKFVHLTGVVISGKSVIGENATIYQNVTIGLRNDNDESAAHIGNNVNIGASACILGNVNIGDDVKIGAMSLVLGDIPDKSTYICQVTPKIISAA